MGREAYQEILATKGVSSDPQLNEMVRRVGQRIVRASGQTGLDWQFNVIKDETPNAFALPGGFVGVHTGLFKVVENEAQLAAVMAHEVGHVTAHHPAERMSRQTLVQAGLTALGGASQPTAQIAAAAATLGIILPFSRTQEGAADAIGRHNMPQAGEEPNATVDVQQQERRV